MYNFVGMTAEAYKFDIKNILNSISSRINRQNEVSWEFLKNSNTYFKSRKEIINIKLKLNRLEENSSNKKINSCK